MDIDQPKKKLQKHYEQELLEDYKFDDKALYFVKNDEKYDVIPEIIDGKNIADYIDQDIFEKLEQLEREEELRENAGVYDSSEVRRLWSYSQGFIVLAKEPCHTSLILI